MSPALAPADADQAIAMVHAGLGYLAAADPAAWPPARRLGT